MIRGRLTEAQALDIAGDVDDLREALLRESEARLERGVDVILTRARRNLSQRRGTRRTAAPAGEAPEYDTGGLMRSLEKGRLRRTRTSVRLEYGSKHVAAGLHEFGGTVKKGGRAHRYPARPYLRPAEAAVQREVERILEGEP